MVDELWQKQLQKVRVSDSTIDVVFGLGTSIHAFRGRYSNDVKEMGFLCDCKFVLYGKLFDRHVVFFCLQQM